MTKYALKPVFVINGRQQRWAKMTSHKCVLILNALVKDKKNKKLILTIHITILSPFTKDFRGEGQLDEYIGIFLRSCLGGTDQKELKVPD